MDALYPQMGLKWHTVYWIRAKIVTDGVTQIAAFTNVGFRYPQIRTM